MKNKKIMKMEKDIPSDLEFSTFKVGEGLFGINILDIQEINRLSDITSVPQSPNYIDGILNLRGKIVSIINLGKKLELKPVQKSKNSRIIIIDSQEEYIGLLVDDICDVVATCHNDIEPAPPNIGGVKGHYFQGVLKTEKKLVGILDVNEVLVS